MPYVNVPNDLSKIKTKMAFNLTKRQLVCFGGAAAVGIPSYLLARSSIGNTGAMFLMLAVMLPAFLLAMYERDGLPFEKVIRNIIRARFLRPGARLYQTQNLYAPFTLRGSVGKEDAIATSKKANTQAQRVKNGRPCPPSRQSPMCGCSRTACASSPAGSIQKPWNMRTSIILWQAPRIRRLSLAAGAHSSITLTALCRSSFLSLTAVPTPGAATR